MSAATTAIDTPTREGGKVNLPVAAETKIFAGTLVALNTSGYAVPADDAAGLRVFGRAEATVDNSNGSAGDLSIDVARGVFRFANSETNAAGADDLGKVAFVEDDQTVGMDGGDNDIRAGVIVGVDDDGVWVDTHQIAMPPAVEVVLGNTNGEISGVTIGAPATITPQNTDGEIETVTLAAQTSTDGTAGACTEVGPLATEAEKIGDDVRDVRAKFATLVAKCEDLAEDVIALDTALQTAATKATVETLRGKLEELADDVRAIKAALDAQDILA